MTSFIESIAEWQQIKKNIKQQNKSLGFVPTMGNLHNGHISLLERARQENDISMLSIFINPTQFNNPVDLDRYPRTIDADKKIAKQSGIDYVLLPDYESLYPDQYTYKVSESDFSTQLEGVFRPGHFDGMLTVVLKLLLLISPTQAYFGEKDYQQLKLVEGMAQAFFIDTKIIGCPTIRNEFNLPLSSRNNLLTKEEYLQAQHFPKIFHANLSCEQIIYELTQQGFKVDYVKNYKNRRLAAVWLGTIRLLDNIVVKGEN